VARPGKVHTRIEKNKRPFIIIKEGRNMRLKTLERTAMATALVVAMAVAVVALTGPVTLANALVFDCVTP
jgi:hypothetical protein